MKIIRDKLYKNYARAKTTQNRQLKFESFKKYRNTINLLVKLSKKNHYQEYFREHKNNLKMAWKGIYNIIHSKKN